MIGFQTVAKRSLNRCQALLRVGDIAAAANAFDRLRRTGDRAVRRAATHGLAKTLCIGSISQALVRKALTGVGLPLSEYRGMPLPGDAAQQASERETFHQLVGDLTALDGVDPEIMALALVEGGVAPDGIRACHLAVGRPSATALVLVDADPATCAESLKDALAAFPQGIRAGRRQGRAAWHAGHTREAAACLNAVMVFADHRALGIDHRIRKPIRIEKNCGGYQIFSTPHGFFATDGIAPADYKLVEADRTGTGIFRAEPVMPAALRGWLAGHLPDRLVRWTERRMDLEHHPKNPWIRLMYRRRPLSVAAWGASVWELVRKLSAPPERADPAFQERKTTP